MNPAYNKTLSLLVEIKSNYDGNPNDKDPDNPFREPGGRDRTKRVRRANKPKATLDDITSGKVKPSWSGSTDPKPSSDEGPTVSRNNPETLEFLKPREGEQETPKKKPLYKRILNAFMRKFGRRKGK